MIYCYIDESGSPSRNDKRPFIVAMVIFGSLDEVKFVRFVRKEVKDFDVFEASKDIDNDGCEELADMIALSLSSKEKYRFYIDENPRLQAVLKKAFKTHKKTVRISQTSSRNNELVQIADYIAGIASEKRH